MKIKIKLTGTNPLLLHNSRLANPLDPYARAKAEITGKRKKTDEDYARIMQLEARGSVYETPDGKLGHPTQNVWRCLYDAAKSFKRGEDVKRSLIEIGDVTVPLLVNGKQIAIDAFLENPENIDYRPVTLSKRKTMRARPIVRKWESAHEFDLLTDILDLDVVKLIARHAGRVVGVGDWRPKFGKFEAVIGKAK